MNTTAELIDLLGGTSAVARRVGVKPPSVHEWRGRSIPDDKLMLLGADIERVTNNRLMRWDLFPTRWHRIWPELIGTAGAPAVPAVPTEPPPAPEVEPPAEPACAAHRGGRRESDHTDSGFGELPGNGDAIGRRTGNGPKREGGDAA